MTKNLRTPQQYRRMVRTGLLLGLVPEDEAADRLEHDMVIHTDGTREHLIEVLMEPDKPHFADYRHHMQDANHQRDLADAGGQPERPTPSESSAPPAKITHQFMARLYVARWLKDYKIKYEKITSKRLGSRRHGDLMAVVTVHGIGPYVDVSLVEEKASLFGFLVQFERREP